MSITEVKDTITKERITHRGKALLDINLHYPEFVCENDEVSKKLNDYYAQAQREFSVFCKTRYAKVLISEREAGKSDLKKSGAVMNWYISYMNDSVLSILLDISIFDGKNKTTKRYVNNWKLPECVPYLAKNLFLISRMKQKEYTDIIVSKIREAEGGFKYFENAETVARKRFDFDRFYLTPNGVAFYYDKNTLFASFQKFPAFIIPYNKVENLQISTEALEK